MPTMRSALVPLLASVLLLLPVMAAAHHDEAYRATNFKTSVVKAYQPCTSPNTTTSNGFPACVPAVESVETCDFGEFGSGKAYARVLLGPVHDVELNVRLKRLAANCEGHVLVGVASVRGTTDDCAGEACTFADIADFPIGSCTVTDGQCVMKGTVNGTLPGTLLTGRVTGLEILGCGVLDGTARVFSCGLLVP
jgi:hypothetical protein